MKAPPALFLDDVPGGPPPGTLLARLDELPHHGGKDITFTEDQFMVRVFVQKMGETIAVFENRCPHAGTPLNLFDDRFMDLSGSHLICRTHGARFRMEDGLCTLGPCKGQFLRAVEHEIRDGGIYTV